MGDPLAVHGVERAGDMHPKSSASSIAADKECIAWHPGMYPLGRKARYGSFCHSPIKPAGIKSAGCRLLARVNRFGVGSIQKIWTGTALTAN